MLHLFLSACAPSLPGPTINLTVNPREVIRRDADRFVGINLNYIRDADANRPTARPLREAIQDLGARWLRYPGGEKSDLHRWSLPPYTAPQSTSLKAYADFPGTRMDFDAFMRLVHYVKAEPYLVVSYDRPDRSGLSEAEHLADAVAWVKYANRTKRYGVRYWEIGNENWHNATSSPEAMARVVQRFSAAMKAVDPTIRVGASGNNREWWDRFLPEAAASLDFISLSNYSAWDFGGYARYTKPPLPDLQGGVRDAVDAARRQSPARPLEVIVTETNSKDYAPNGWTDENSMGHALVSFDLFGGALHQPGVTSAMLWTTRWMEQKPATSQVWYALDDQNKILAAGRAVALWGRFALPWLVTVTGGTDSVAAYATVSPRSDRFTVWIVNRSLESANVSVRVLDSPNLSRGTVQVLTGTGPNDIAPTFGPAQSVAVKDGALPLMDCPPVSISVIRFQSRN